MPAPTSPPARLSFWDTRAAFVLGAFVLFAALLAAYANSFRVPFILDDADSISLNPTIRKISTAWLPPSNSGITTSGRPLLNVSLAINYAIHGNEIFGYHVGNLLIHGLAALVLWAVIRRTLRQPLVGPLFSASATPLAWCAAALWALHPLQTESVTYIVQRAESLVGLFYLLTLYGFIRFAQVDHSARSRAPVWFAVTVLACLAGMASKEVMASAPLIVLLYDRTFVSGSFAEAWRKHRTLHVSLAATWLLLLACVIQSGGRGTSVGYAQITWWEYAITQAPAIARYLWRAIWPANLIFDYGAIVEKNPAVVIPSCLLIIALLIAAVYSLRRRPLAGFAFAWFFLILAPTSSIVPVATQTAAEHRMYLPLAAIVVPATVGLFQLSARAAFLLLPILLVAAGVRTHVRNHDYRTPLSIWEDTAARIPDSVRARNNYGSMLFDLNRVDDAVVQFKEAIQLVPKYADAWQNLGCAMLRLQRFPEAISAIENAISINPQKDLYYATLGNAFFEANQIDKAIEAYRKAYELAPTVPIHAYNLGNTFLRLDRLKEAGDMLRFAHELAPNDLEITTNYAIWLRRSDRPAEAIPLLREALQQRPNSARIHSNLGIALIQTGRAAEGIRELETALPLDPSLPQTRYNLGSAYAENGRPTDAIPQFESLIQLSTPTAEILDNLGVLYAQTGRYQEAVATFRRALAIDANHRNARSNLEAVEAFIKKQNTR